MGLPSDGNLIALFVKIRHRTVLGSPYEVLKNDLLNTVDEAALVKNSNNFSWQIKIKNLQFFEGDT